MEVNDYVVDSKLKIRVTPNAKKTEVKGVKDDLLLVNVAAPPDKNKANLEVVKYFSKLLKKKVKIKKGLKSKEKTLVIG
ncbi:DUF167 domain-containing protein [Candidatus Woesearchaeota archaeon]|nr:DUF167 domain-containing protein [Candidatus Woesearchaeota archaeon]